MFDSVREKIRRVISAILTAALIAALGGGGSVQAQPTNLKNDVDAHPVTIPNVNFPMTMAQSRFIANQLKPVQRTLHPRGFKPRGSSDWLTPSRASDPFFRDNVGRYLHYPLGKVVRKREAYFDKLSFPGARIIQYVYRSTDSRGYPMLASSSLVIPRNLKPNANVLTWMVHINASGPDCSVSGGLYGPTTGSIQNTQYVVGLAVQNGFPVLLPDGTGPRASYGINRLSSHVILDGLRMVHKQKDFPLKKSKFVIGGVSHGALMTGYAAVEQGSYAPELNSYINQWVIHEGAPDFIKLSYNFGLFGDLGQVPNPHGGFLVNFIIGAAREYPDRLKNLENWLQPHAKAIFSASKEVCMPFSVLPAMGQHLPSLFKEGFFQSQTFREIIQIAKESSSLYFPGKPTAPVMLLHGDLDEILYQADEDRYLHQTWCKAGLNSVYVEYPLGGHFVTPVVTIPRMAVTIQNALDGKLQTRHCPGALLL